MKRLWRRMHRGNKGFTLIELLIVVAIIGVLAAVAVPALVRFIGAGEEEAARTEWETIQTAMEALMTEHRLTAVAVPTTPLSIFDGFDVHPGTGNVTLYPGYLRIRVAGGVHGDPDSTIARYTWGPEGRVTSSAFRWEGPPTNRYVWVITP